jgi:hypothetical protein
MSHDFGNSSGLIVPLRFFLPLITGSKANKLHITLLSYQSYLRGFLKKDDEDLAQYRFSRECYDFVANQVIPSYVNIRSEIEGSIAEEKRIQETFRLWIEDFGRLFNMQSSPWDGHSVMCDILGRVFTDTFGKNNMPTLNEIRTFDSPDDHGDAWSMGGLMSSFEGPAAELSAAEFEQEIHGKPCFVFEDSECFHVVPSPKGRKFKAMLGVGRFEASQWVWQSY